MKMNPVLRTGRSITRTGLAIGAIGAISAVLGGCSATEYHYEGPGIEDDPASSSVPTGMIGVCKRRFTERPPIVNPVLWEHAKWCTASTNPSFIRLGFGSERGDKFAALKRVNDMMASLKKAKEERSNAVLTKMMGDARDAGKTDPWLEERISRQSARTSVCDYHYLFDKMEPEAKTLRAGEDRGCAALAYDQKDRKQICLFDTSPWMTNDTRPPGMPETAIWLTSGWACMTHTGERGNSESCHRLCQYDDYCSQQVSCAGPDVDLALCALGVCLPQNIEIIY
ncbi:MAG: hypothetical protein U0414_26240 [Polyangiaceae bacterium]